MADEHSEPVPAPPESDWVRSDRDSTRVALAIALLPIPIALLISWALGDPPWRARPPRQPDRARDVPTAPVAPGPDRPGKGHR